MVTMTFECFKDNILFIRIILQRHSNVYFVKYQTS